MFNYQAKSSYGIRVRTTDADGLWFEKAFVIAVWMGGDANGDGVVDVADLGIEAGNYGTLTGMTWATGDFTGDGAVGIGDLTILAGNYGQGAAMAPGLVLGARSRTAGGVLAAAASHVALAVSAPSTATAADSSQTVPSVQSALAAFTPQTAALIVPAASHQTTPSTVAAPALRPPASALLRAPRPAPMLLPVEDLLWPPLAGQRAGLSAGATAPSGLKPETFAQAPAAPAAGDNLDLLSDPIAPVLRQVPRRAAPARR